MMNDTDINSSRSRNAVPECRVDCITFVYINIHEEFLRRSNAHAKSRLMPVKSAILAEENKLLQTPTTAHTVRLTQRVNLSNRQTDSQKDRQTDSQKDSKTDRQTQL